MNFVLTRLYYRWQHNTPYSLLWFSSIYLHTHRFNVIISFGFYMSLFNVVSSKLWSLRNQRSRTTTLRTMDNIHSRYYRLVDESLFWTVLVLCSLSYNVLSLIQVKRFLPQMLDNRNEWHDRIHLIWWSNLFHVNVRLINS